MGSIFISDWACVYTVLHAFDTPCSNSAGGMKMDPVQSVPFRFTCNPIRNTPKLRFDNRMASMQMRFIDCLTNRERKGLRCTRNEIILARNNVTGLFSRLRLNTHTLERFLYRVQESDPP